MIVRLKEMYKFLVVLICLFVGSDVSAQVKILRGVIRDVHSLEPVPFASIEFKKTSTGKLSDSSGAFEFRFNEWPTDTVLITYVGYQDFLLPIDSNLVRNAKNNVIDVTIQLERGKYAAEVVVRKTIDRGYLMWKRIVRRKPFNDRYRFDNFGYELYNKLEVDIKNLKPKRIENIPLLNLKKFNFIFNNIDTTEDGNPYLPIYLTEAISDYYYQRSPKRRREVFKGTKTLGVNNESVSKLLGGMDQNINFYNNFIPVMDKKFISPISDNGDNYYRYKVLDTQVVAGRRLIHFTFTAKRKGENTFEGDCWIHDTTFAVQKMNLRLSKDANINYVDKLSLIQEYKLINDSTWFLSRDKFVADLSALGEKSLSAIGRKTTTYDNVLVNNPKIVAELDKNTQIEETILPDSARNVSDSFWVQSRHEDLTKSEKALYQTIDTLLKMPSFKTLTRKVNFLTTGYLNIGNYQIGPWFNWITYNVQEGMRMRFDLGTNKHFSKKIILHTYLAYGFADEKFKYQLDGMYLFKCSPRTYIYASVKSDMDYGQFYYDQLTQDNIFALAIRKNGVPIKFMSTNEQKVNVFKEWKSGFSIQVEGLHESYQPLQNLPPKTNYEDDLITTEFSVKLRYAYLERYLESTFYRYSLGSPLPILDLKYTRGIKDVFGSSFNYNKISGSVSDYSDIAPFGSLYYNVFAGRTFGKLPYMLLDVAPGNEIYYYNKYAFNLMNRYEYIQDRYAGVNIEHNFGNGIFRVVPFMRKLKWRQFWSAKALWGSLSDENKAYNEDLNSTLPKFESLNGKTYLELGTGIDNIFRFFRVDFIWRLSPTPLPPEKAKRFGVFFSFRLAF
ncbi:DUF5686 family protein [Flavitalea sp.]|nr:DUF5686 family protein [Flavitalea sp.]